MTLSVRDSELTVISNLAAQYGAHVAHGVDASTHLIVAEFDRVSFTFRQPPFANEEYRLDWYAGISPLNPEVFDKVNGDRDRHGVILANDFETLRQRMPGVFEAVCNGFAFRVH